ncbi:unnamed protein product [Clonostachys rosea]|uniref:MMS19 nucleotide excision repair protein n=1 Tax=Bionectria ochroleuca TaxID=29856 RepID=A0ABY6UWA2_BIOOC|nr:unnamed protein product [Clonostachys rosea]
MADFRQLALEYVLADDETKLTSLAKQAASELQNAAAPTNPVARWVEAVQPWMPGSQGDDEMADGDSPDWTARAKALEFLSRTLDFLGTDVLKPSQIKLLVSFFGAMFDIDHKAGILASATALSRISAMKSFQATSANDIIQKVCTLKDDFPRQVAKTRLAVFELLKFLITSPETSKSLQSRHGASASFMSDLIRLCQNERDPANLMVWFEILTYFLREYSPSKEILEEVYNTFKAYFPISLPRTSPTGITPDQLKLSLRACFSSNKDLAPLTFPFLLGKLDQGDGVTANVKLDVLKTIQACIEEYQNPHDSVTPYFNQIWGSLKYEVRNGEVEDSIWATLEVLKAIAVRLEGEDLRDYALTVTRDCVNDLSSTLYTAPAGRLLVSVLSAGPAAFVLMAAPAVTHIKENLRHPKAPAHSRDLLKLLQVILETRIFLVDAKMTASERSDFSAIDTIFKTLNDDVFRNPVQLGAKEGATEDEIRLATEAVQGAGALVCQRSSGSIATSDGTATGSDEKLLPEDTCSQICDSLFAIITYGNSAQGQATRSKDSDELVNSTTTALQRAVTANPKAFPTLVEKAFGIVASSPNQQETASSAHEFGSLLAYVGCSKLPQKPAEGLRNYLVLVKSLQVDIVSASTGSLSVWGSLAASIQSAARYFNEAFLELKPERSGASWNPSWASAIVSKYPGLDLLDRNAVLDGFNISESLSISEAYGDFLLATLYIVRQLYQKATEVTEVAGVKALQLDGKFNRSEGPLEHQYLHFIAALAGFVLHETSEEQQLNLRAHEFALNLFHDDALSATNGTDDQNSSAWDWLIVGRPNTLSLGVLDSLHPSSVSRLFESGVAQQVLLRGVTISYDAADSVSRAVSRSILTIFSNKHKIETVEPLITQLNQQAQTVLQQAQNSVDAESSSIYSQSISLFAIAAGVLRRFCGKQIQPLLKLLSEVPTAGTIGKQLSQHLELVVAPQAILSKENFAVVKPLWMQKIYFQLVKPLLEAALAPPAADAPANSKASINVGVLSLIKHMNFPIYEEDSEKVMRIAISTAQSDAAGVADTRAALEVLKNIVVESPDKGESHARSIIDICVGEISLKTSRERDAETGKIAMEIMVGLPRLFDSRHLLPHRPQVERELALACGNPVRELRRLARVARAAWSDLK